PWVIRKLTVLKVGQAVREDGPQTHLVKAGTPTMGGTLILVSIGLTTLLWADLNNRFIWLVLLVTLGTGIIGFIDDYKKVALRNPAGLSARAKLAGQSVLALAAGWYLWHSAPSPSSFELIVPFFKHIAYPFGLFGF